MMTLTGALSILVDAHIDDMESDGWSVSPLPRRYHPDLYAEAWRTVRDAVMAFRRHIEELGKEPMDPQFAADLGHAMRPIKEGEPFFVIDEAAGIPETAWRKLGEQEGGK